MDAVTYPDPDVQHELSTHWLPIKIDVAERQPVAETCGVTAIPAVLVVDPSGRVLGTIRGFVEPAGFREQLEDLRGTK